MWLSATSLCVVPDLEATKKQLLDSEREKGELVTQYQQRVEEVEYLKRWACLHLLKSLIHVATVTQEFAFFPFVINTPCHVWCQWVIFLYIYK